MQYLVTTGCLRMAPQDLNWTAPTRILVRRNMLLCWPAQKTTHRRHPDMTFFETAHGGAVFSTGSITFCGSLVTSGCENDVSQLLKNVVDRFLDPAPFEMPDNT
jgi:hypothetical protein